MVEPSEIVQLQKENAEAVERIADLIGNSRCEVLILSHEFLCRQPNAIKNIFEKAKAWCDDVRIIGYSRRQSDWLVSAYAQWYFRNNKLIDKNALILQRHDLTPTLFSVLEQNLLATILSNFSERKEWEELYGQIEQTIGSETPIIKCGLLPNKTHSFNLIEDFCEKAGLTLGSEGKAATELIGNKSFDHYLVEAIGNATAVGLKVPTVHEDNQILSFISSQMETTEKKPIEDDFLITLKQHIDAYFLPSNLRFCQKYGLDEQYFEVGVPHPDIIGFIRAENEKRMACPVEVIEEYRLLSGIMAETCIRLAKQVEQLEKEKKRVKPSYLQRGLNRLRSFFKS